MFCHRRQRQQVSECSERGSGIILTTANRGPEDQKEVIHFAWNNFSFSESDRYVVGKTPVGEDVSVALLDIENVEEVPRL